MKGNRSGSIGDSSAGFNLGETDGAVVDLASFMSAPEGVSCLSSTREYHETTDL